MQEDVHLDLVGAWPTASSLSARISLTALVNLVSGSIHSAYRLGNCHRCLCSVSPTSGCRGSFGADNVTLIWLVAPTGIPASMSIASCHNLHPAACVLRIPFIGVISVLATLDVFIRPLVLPYVVVRRLPIIGGCRCWTLPQRMWTSTKASSVAGCHPLPV